MLIKSERGRGSNTGRSGRAITRHIGRANKLNLNPDLGEGQDDKTNPRQHLGLGGGVQLIANIRLEKAL